MTKIPAKIYCKRCKRRTNHQILSDSKNNVELTYTISGNPYDDGLQFEDEYHIVQCMGCEKVAFLNVYSGEDCQNIDEYGEMYYDTLYTIYPEEPIKSAKRVVIEAESFKHVPTFINQIYNEVIASFNNQSTLLPAAGLRTIVEAICKDTHVTNGQIYNDENEIIMKDGEPVLSSSLKGKINGLQQAGIITNPQKNVLHQVRKLGNYAVHEIAFPKLRTIRMGIEVIENILTNIYELDKFSLGLKE